MIFDGSATRESLQKAEKEFATGILRALQRSADTAAGYARTSTLYKNHTFALRNSIDARVIGGLGGVFGAGGDPRAHVAARARHATFVENGTKAHPITPRKFGGLLRFEQNGAVRFARLVRHPGTQPRPFMQQARDRVEPVFERLVREAAERALG